MLFRIMIGLLMLSGLMNVIFHVSLNNLDGFSVPVIYFFRITYHMLLFSILFLLVLYAMIPLRLDKDSDKRYIILAAVGYGITFAYEVLGSILKFGFHITESGEVVEGFNAFSFSYIFYVSILLFMMVKYRNRLVRPFMRGVISSYFVSVSLMVIQAV